MRNFEYVKILNKKEVSNFISSMAARYSSESKESQKLLEENKELLLNEYRAFENEIIQEYKVDLKNFNDLVNLWNDKKCQCGRSLNFISGYDFWGCPNYLDKTKKHLSFSENQESIFEHRVENIKVRLSHNWSSEILKRCNLTKKIKAKELLTFYIYEGLEDLREKYGYKNSMESISAFIYAKQNSRKEEEEIRDFLKKYFTKVSFQLYIEFKEINDLKKIRIIDLMVSDEQFVYLIEIKRHNIYVDEQQLELYYDLIAYLMRIKNDTRVLKSLFIVNEYYESTYNFNKCVQFDKLSSINEKSKIIEEFNDSIFK